MIQFNFADMRQRAKWTEAKFDIRDKNLTLDEGLNLGGQCKNKLQNGESCGTYNVLPLGMLSKSEKIEDVHKLRDIKKMAHNVIVEPPQEDRKFILQDHQLGECPNCKQKIKTANLKHAIFYNCKYEVKFLMKERGDRRVKNVIRKGIIAHQTKVALFENNIQQCNGIMGSIEPLTPQEFRNQTLSSWLWENNF